MTARTYVALDVETTGLDPEKDRITEIAAVRFDSEGNTLDTFETLIDPGRPIPRFVETLTGITSEDVRGAPRVAAVASRLRAFVDDGPLVGQNVGFDLAYLRREGVALDVPVIDTAELSRILLPARQGRGLAELAAALGVEPGNHHRALPDAHTAAAVFVALRRLADELSAGLRLQLARLVSLHNLALAEVLAGAEWQDVPLTERDLPTVRPAPAWPALVRREPAAPVSPVDFGRAFAAARQAIDQFEERPQQAEMAEAIRGAFNEGGHWLIEAGTGVGKSLAYLIPAALYALRNGERVVVSTNTINLQEQLLQKDIPALRSILKAAGLLDDDSELRVTLLKGRGNYLCLRRWTASYGAHLADPDFARLGAAMLLWLPTTETGDRAELNFDHTDWLTWQRFSAQDTDCLSRPNAFVREGRCFLQRARKAAESAHLVIANHALLLADLASGGSALPPFDHLIVDEAHNLEDQATQQFGGSVSRRLLADALDGLHRRAGREQREGGVAALLKTLPEGAALFAGRALEQAVAAAVALLTPTFEALTGFVPRNGEDDRVLLSAALRAQPAWSTVETAWAALDGALRDVNGRALAAGDALTAAPAVEEPDVLAGEVETAARKLEEQRILLARLVSGGDESDVVWIGRERDGTGSLNSAPLDVGPTLWENLFIKKRTVIATSATLSTAGDMEYAARRLGLERPRTLQLGSPFDYERSTLLAAFTDIPEPNDPRYEEAVANAVVELVGASEGRALALFTSHATLRRVASLARPRLEEQNVSLFAQGLDGTPRQLTASLVENPRTVVFGTSSFWEGVDVRGDALSLLIIARLPFAVPSDPVYRARSELYDNPFAQYALPAAILRFRQGFGRLIRDRNDRGVVAVLDRRVYEKAYGRDFVASLPPCTKLRAATAVVAERTREWLER